MRSAIHHVDGGLLIINTLKPLLRLLRVNCVNCSLSRELTLTGRKLIRSVPQKGGYATGKTAVTSGMRARNSRRFASVYSLKLETYFNKNTQPNDDA